MANRLERGLAAAAAAVQAGVALAILRWGDTGPIPMHFGWNGAVDRYGERGEATATVGAMALLTLFAPFAIRALSRRRLDGPGEFREAILMLAGVTSLISALVAALAFGLVGEASAGLGVMWAVGAILAVIGAYVGKVEPNALIGVRTPWSFASRLAWDKSNRLAGRLFFWIGLAGVFAAPFLQQPAGLQGLAILILAAAGLAVFESWRVWRADPDRTGAL